MFTSSVVDYFSQNLRIFLILAIQRLASSCHQWKESLRSVHHDEWICRADPLGVHIKSISTSTTSQAHRLSIIYSIRIQYHRPSFHHHHHEVTRRGSIIFRCPIISISQRKYICGLHECYVYYITYIYILYYVQILYDMNVWTHEYI